MPPRQRSPSVPKAKAKGKAKAKAAEVVHQPAAAAPAGSVDASAAARSEPPGPVEPEQPHVDVAEITIAEAEKMLKALGQAELVALAASKDAVEQLPARMALVFVGDKDSTWANAQASLKTGRAFVKEMLEMEGDKYVTRSALETYDQLGSLDLDALATDSSSPAARVVGLYVSACIRSARGRFGPTPCAPAAAPPGEPPQWPVTIEVGKVIESIFQAADWNRTALVVCGGHASTVDTFLAYRGYKQLDAKWVLSQNVVKKTMSVEEIREEVRTTKIVSAIKNGLPLGIAMSNSAVAFKETYCAEGTFPPSVFNWGLFKQEDEYSKLIRDSDLESWVGAFPGKLKEGTVTFVTTDFTLEKAREYLPTALPYFDEMAIYVVDGSSVES